MSKKSDMQVEDSSTVLSAVEGAKAEGKAAYSIALPEHLPAPYFRQAGKAFFSAKGELVRPWAESASGGKIPACLAVAILRRRARFGHACPPTCPAKPWRRRKFMNEEGWPSYLIWLNAHLYETRESGGCFSRKEVSTCTSSPVLLR